MLIPVAARSKASICDCSLSGITGSTPAGDMGISRECCVLSGCGPCDGPIPPPDESY